MFATFYQLYLQRRHDEKSLKPLVQIDLIDRNMVIAVHVQNNGVGPLIIDMLTFIKNGVSHANIDDCLALDPKSYQRIPVAAFSQKVIVPGNYLEIFSMQCIENDTDEKINNIKRQLAVLILKVDGRDIYNNKVVAERDLNWFMRHL